MRFAAAILVVTVSAFLISFVPVVHAADEYGLDTVAGSAELKGLGEDVPRITGRFLGAALSLVGILFFILTIYGGVLWMTSHGNAEQSSKGLKTTIAATIGLVIVLAAYTITNFVFQTVAPPPGTCLSDTTPPGSGCVGQGVGDQCTNAGTGRDGRCQFDTGRNGCLCI